MDIFFIVTALAIAIATAFYFFVRRTYTYWDRMNFKTPPNYNYLTGHFLSTFLQRESFGDFLIRMYNQTKEPYIGIYGVFRPILLVRDPELIRSILVKDFNSFTDRGVHCNEIEDPLSGHLFSLPGQKWRNLRAKLTPTFTSGKLKSMFSTLVECGGSLQNYLDDAATSGRLVDIGELSASHATNVISSVAFGIDVDTIKNPNNDFRKYGRKIFALSLKNAFRLTLNFIAPKLMTIFKIHIVEREVEDFIFGIVKQNLEYREKNNVTRKDFFQLLIQLRNTGSVQLDDKWETVIKSDENQKQMTINEIAAQVFVFFAAGFRTSSSTLSFCLFELAKNQDIQERVINEIDNVLEMNNGNLTYDCVNDMKYLECCIDETLRKYPTLPMLNRSCVKNYQIPGTDQIIEEGVEIFIPAWALQRDPKFYPEPIKFKPERFSETSSAGKNQVNRPFFSFGDGPRNCIGMRLGKLQTKVGLIMMLQKFRYELEPEKRNLELEFDPKSPLTVPKGGINLLVFKR